MAIKKHSDFLHKEQGSYSNTSPVNTSSKLRLNTAEYKKLEQSIVYPHPGATDLGSLGIQVGIDRVLKAVREGFIIG